MGFPCDRCLWDKCRELGRSAAPAGAPGPGKAIDQPTPPAAESKNANSAPHGTAPLLAGAAGSFVAHHLVDDRGRDAGILQPGREGVAKVVGAVQIHGLQQRIRGRGQRQPALLSVLADATDQLGKH
jgi:hypothetical protein